MNDSTHPGTKTALLRASRNLTVEELAQQSGCEPAMIEELEQGRLAPSLAPLARISRALGVRLGTLLDEDEKVGPVLCRKGEARSVTRFRTGTEAELRPPMEYLALAEGKSARHMDPFIVNLEPNQANGTSTHEGEELLYVLEGAVQVDYGKDRFRLEVGDSFYFDSIVPHRVFATGEQTARVLSVVYTPS